MQAKKDAALAQKQVQDDDDDRPLKPTAGVKSERSKTDIRLSQGSRVRIEGLKAKPELNGRFGVIIGQFNEESGRWTVRVDADGDKAACQLAVKPENLSSVAAEEARQAAAAAPARVPLPMQPAQPALTPHSPSSTTATCTRASLATTPTPPKQSTKGANFTAWTQPGTSAPIPPTRFTCARPTPGPPTFLFSQTAATTTRLWDHHFSHPGHQVQAQTRMNVFVRMTTRAGTQRYSEGALKEEGGQYGGERPDVQLLWCDTCSSLPRNNNQHNPHLTPAPPPPQKIIKCSP